MTGTDLTKRIGAAVAMLLAAVTTLPAHASEAAATAGANWLRTQVAPDGTLLDETRSVATPAQQRAEALHAIALITQNAPAALVERVEASVDDDAEHLARALPGLVLGARPTGPARARLAAAQNTDGGFALYAGAGSNSLDTGLALAALGADPGADPQLAQRALGYLGTARDISGAHGVHRELAVYVTAYALVGAEAWKTRYDVGALAQAATTWLLAQRQSGHYASPLDDAVALLALLTRTNDAAVLGPIADALVAAQLPNGSWSDDPFVTALAARALWRASRPPPAPTTGGVAGRVTNASNNQPLAGATIALVERTDIAATSRADGTFDLTAVPPGVYTLRAAAIGFATRQAQVTVQAGQVVQVGTIALAPAPLSASLSGVVRTTAGAAIADALVAIGTISTTTNAQGQYALSGISAGTATITVSKLNFTTLQVVQNFEAGRVYTFSPTLYPTSQTPPTDASLKGRVLDAATNAAIAGARIVVGAREVTTGADGRFTLTALPIGAFSGTISANTYIGVSMSGVLSAGPNDVGDVKLAKAPTTSTLTGVVSDIDTSAPIPGAVVTVVGTSLTSTAGAGGVYRIEGIANTAFQLLVTATGYADSRFDVSLPQPGTATLDLRIAPATPQSGVSFREVRTSRPEYAPYDEFEIEAEVHNTSTSATQLVVDAQVLDASGAVVFELKANAKGLGLNPPNLPITIPASSIVEVELERTLLRQTAGVYTVVVRGTGSDGRVVAQGTAQFAVRLEALLGGGVIVDPPMTQAGIGVPINIDAELTNLGNETIPAGDYELTVRLEAQDTQTATQPRTELSSLQVGTPVNQPQGSTTDAQGNVYIANRGGIVRHAPDGTASLVAAFPNVTLEDVARAADGTFWVAEPNTRYWRIDPAGTRTEFRSTTLASIQSLALAANGDLLLAGQVTGGWALVRRNAASGVETVLARNGLASPLSLVRLPGGDLLVSNSGDHTVSRVRANGVIEPFLSGFSTPWGLARAADGTLYVANNGNGTVERIATDGTRSVYASGLTDVTDIELDAAGNLYVANRNANTISRVPAGGGAAQIVARGFANNPYPAAIDAAGDAYVAGDDGLLMRKRASGEISVIATGLSGPRDVEVADDTIYATNFHNGSIVRVAGTQSTFATGLAGPFGLARTDGGELYVTEYSANRIARLGPTGTVLERIESAVNSPSILRHDVDGRLYIANSGYVSVRENGVTRILQRSSYTDIAPDATAGGVVAISGRNVYRISPSGTQTLLKTAAFHIYGGVVALADGSVVVPDRFGRKLHRLDPAGNWSEYATLTANPLELVIGADATIYVRGEDRAVYKVAPDRTVSTLVPALNALYLLSLSQDGRPIVFAHHQNTFRILAIDPSSGALTTLENIISTVNGIALDAQGALTRSDSGGNRLVEVAGGVTRNALVGFRNPRDLLWTGSELRFTDESYLFALVPGAYPTRLGNFRSDSLTLRGGELYGVNGGAIVRWNGTASITVVSIPGTSQLGDLAAYADGRLLVTDYSGGRVVELSAANAITVQYASLVGPTGLGRDANGLIHVAGSNGTISRLPADGTAPIVAARGVTSLRDLAFDPAGALIATRGTTISRVDLGSGAVTDLASGTAALWGIVADANGIAAADSSRHQVRGVANGQLTVRASGLAGLRSVRESPQGILLASNSNGTVSRYGADGISVVASNLASPQGIAARADGSFVVVGDSGSGYLIGADGTAQLLRISSLIDSALLAGVAERADGSLLLSGYTTNTIYRLAIVEPVPPPPVGTIVHTATRNAPLLPAADGIVPLDFGSWLPPYGGDFSVTVARTGLAGATTNFVHVGPHANGVFTALVERVPPGDQAVPLRIALEGADFTSVSRVETGQFRKLVNIFRPRGMIADRAGNLYFTDDTKLNKVAPDGTATAIVTGINAAFGLAIDSAENLYLPVNVSGQYQVQRVAPDGTRSVVANLGTTATNGIAVDSRDQILVGRYGSLLRVDPATGAQTVVTTTGIARPLGIAVDGRDNIYVQNTDHHVTQIRPDGTARTIFAGADGVTNPSFEGDGYPTITADCADNFYITAWQWQQVNQNGEEHILSQVVPRTGQVVGLLDVTRVDPRVADIDYLSFDRFGNRILMWDHSTSAIYQVPVTCGAISVEAHVITKPGQTLRGFDRAPAASVALPDGRTEYVWSLRDVTAGGLALNFDTDLVGLTLGERRKVAHDAFIVFKNTFSPIDVRVRMAVPSVPVEDLVALEVVTDRAEYLANATAKLTTTLRNANTWEVSGELRVAVLDAAGSVAGTLPPRAVSLPVGGELVAEGNFLIGALLPAQYTVRATLHGDGGELARDDTTFRVIADNAAASARAELQLDRARYAPNDRVQVTSRAVSQSANVVLENLVLTTRVARPDGTTLETWTHAIAQLLPGATRAFPDTLVLQNAAAGIYNVQTQLTDATGRVLGTRTATFEVESSAQTGTGLTGTLSAVPSQAEVGTPIALRAVLSNGGNADFAALPVRIAVLDLAAGTSITSFTATVDIARGAQTTLDRSWTTTGVPAGTYTVVLSATVGAREITLARSEVVLTAVTVRVDVTQRIDLDTRLLVWLGCTGDDDDDCDDRSAEIEPDLNSGENGNDPHRCRDIATRRDFLKSYLASLGISHTIVTDDDAFLRELRSGRYNTYWLNGPVNVRGHHDDDDRHGGGHDDDDDDENSSRHITELAEAVYRGAGLFVDGSHDRRESTLTNMLGVKPRGRLSQRDPPVTIGASSIYAATTLQVIGTGRRFELRGATAQGRFGTSATTGEPALTTNPYGRGRTVLMAYDFVDMLKSRPTSAPQINVLNRTLRHVTPTTAPAEYGVGSYVPLITTLVNRGVGVELEITMTAPTGVVIETTDPVAQRAGNSVTWRLRLEAAASRELDAGLRITTASGPVAIETRVSVVNTGGTTLLSTHRFDLVARSMTERYDSARQLVQALTPTKSSEREARDQTLVRLERGVASYGSGRYEQAIADFLDARDRLLRITSVDIGPSRLAVSELIRAAGYRWYATTQP